MRDPGSYDSARFFNLWVHLNTRRPARPILSVLAPVLAVCLCALVLAHTALGAAVDLRVAQDRQVRMGAW